MIARELRAARGWLIAVALLSLVVQILVAYNLPPKVESKHQLLLIIACVQFAVFFGAWLLSHWKPKFSLILALIAFWIIQVFVIVASPLESAFSPTAIGFRLAFTLALIGGVSAADRAEKMAGNRQTSDTPAAPDEDASGVVASASDATSTPVRQSPPTLRPEVIVSAQSNSEADALVKRAQDHHFAKKFAEAIELYEEVVTRFPDSKQAARARTQIKNLR